MLQQVPRRPSKNTGGVEVLLEVREAKTKKNAILWTSNVTVVSAQLGLASKIGYILVCEKVIHISITEYIYPSRGAGKGVEHNCAYLVLPGCFYSC